MANVKSTPVIEVPLSNKQFCNPVASVLVLKAHPFWKVRLVQDAPSVIVPFFSPMDMPVQLSPRVTCVL